MAWSKEKRIITMLLIDAVFFLVELGGGIYAHSLALQADAFHMLNDIISLAIGYWAVRAASKATSDKYTYGWLRAEVIGAFFNAVFLIALCVSILLEAITRFIDPPEIRQPQLIFGVGCFGLTSNLIGFFVLGGHGHGHGSEDHDHDHDHDQNHGHKHDDNHDHAGHAHHGEPDHAPHHVYDHDNTHHRHDHDEHRNAEEGYAGSVTINPNRRIRFDNDTQSDRALGSSRHRRRRSSLRHSRLTDINDICIYPASFRQEIIEASRDDDDASETDPDDRAPTETSRLISDRGSTTNGTVVAAAPKGRGIHAEHHHSMPKKPAKKGHGHSHGDMGMNAMVLHVIGDALGNVGVIVTALIVWLSTWSWKNYTDPAVSLLIAAIILKSALPLTAATARILLQATPDHIDVSEIREDIEALEGVKSCHHMHVWQLSDTKLVASMHMQVDFDFSEQGGRRYMDLALRVRECLHGHGIHSATIQPEFRVDLPHNTATFAGDQPPIPGIPAAAAAAAGIVNVAPDRRCILDECIENCVGQGCCTGSTESASGSSRRGSHSSHILS